MFWRFKNSTNVSQKWSEKNWIAHFSILNAGKLQCCSSFLKKHKHKKQFKSRRLAKSLSNRIIICLSKQFSPLALHPNRRTNSKQLVQMAMSISLSLPSTWNRKPFRGEPEYETFDYKKLIHEKNYLLANLIFQNFSLYSLKAFEKKTIKGINLKML